MTPAEAKQAFLDGKLPMFGEEFHDDCLWNYDVLSLYPLDWRKEFIANVFELDWALLTAGSGFGDFHGLTEEGPRAKVLHHYGVDIPNIEDLYLWEAWDLIFRFYERTSN